MKNTTLTPADVDKIAKLAHLVLTKKQKDELTKELGITLQYVSQLSSLPTDGVTETSQVTGLENVTREDEIDLARTFSQDAALANAKRIHNGYFVVDKIFE